MHTSSTVAPTTVASDNAALAASLASSTLATPRSTALASAPFAAAAALAWSRP